MDNQSIQHTRWNCTYHIVFIPKYCRKIMYGQVKRDIVDILKKLCEMKQIQLIDGKVCADHVHMYMGIPLKYTLDGYERKKAFGEMILDGTSASKKGIRNIILLNYPSGLYARNPDQPEREIDENKYTVSKWCEISTYDKNLQLENGK